MHALRANILRGASKFEVSRGFVRRAVAILNQLECDDVSIVRKLGVVSDEEWIVCFEYTMAMLVMPARSVKTSDAATSIAVPQFSHMSPVDWCTIFCACCASR